MGETRSGVTVVCGVHLCEFNMENRAGYSRVISIASSESAVWLVIRTRRVVSSWFGLMGLWGFCPSCVTHVVVCVIRVCNCGRGKG
jgi:hypothetical protein